MMSYRAEVWIIMDYDEFVSNRSRMNDHAKKILAAPNTEIKVEAKNEEGHDFLVIRFKWIRWDDGYLYMDEFKKFLSSLPSGAYMRILNGDGTSENLYIDGTGADEDIIYAYESVLVIKVGINNQYNFMEVSL